MSIKTPEQIEKMRVAGRLAAQVLEMIAPHVQAGITTGEINDICHDYIVNQQHAKPASLGYRGFPKSLCISVNHVVCHGIPNHKKLKNGDIVNLDVVIEKNGYHGDTSKTFLVGQPSIKAERLVHVTQQAMILAIKMVRPGVHLGDIGASIQNYAKQHHYTVVKEFCGHGIGTNMHEPPQVLHFGHAGMGEKLQAGMTFTIEPMLNAGKANVKVSPDGWTVMTRDRQLSAQWEHTILVTDNGYEVLTLREEEDWINI